MDNVMEIMSQDLSKIIELSKVNFKYLPTVFNIQGYGAKGDGVTDAYTVFQSVIYDAGSTRPIYFPQNTTNDAVYYFSTTPVLDGLILMADKGVTLSFPSTNGVSFKNVTFLSDISITSRDRNNTAKQSINNYSKLIYASMLNNPADVGIQTTSSITDSNITKNVYTTAGAVVTTSPLILDATEQLYKVDTTVETVTNVARLQTIEFSYAKNYSYNCVFRCLQPETNINFRIGVMAINANNQFVFYSTDFQKKFYNGLYNNAWSETTKDKSAVFTDAYSLSGSLILSIRVTDIRQFEVYVNGVLIDTVTTPFDIIRLGFAMNTVVGAGIGINNTFYGGVTQAYTPKLNNGNTIKAAVFGDSITFGDGSISWAEFLPNILEGQRGINKLNITNYAVVGETANQQYVRMQALDLTPFDMVLIEVGTNDIQQQIDRAAFRTTMTNMINLAKSNGRKVVVGIPPMFISQSLTGIGFTDANYEKGGIYRNIILQVCADQSSVYVADTMSEIGRIGTDNHLQVLRDNLHPNTFGEVLMARCFARSIVASLNRDFGGFIIPALIVNSPTLLNGWLNYGAPYENAGFYKTAEGLVAFKGLVKSGTVASSTVIFNLPLGYRPSSKRMVIGYSTNGTTDTACTLEIATNGDVACSMSVKNTWLSLEGIKFNV